MKHEKYMMFDNVKNYFTVRVKSGMSWSSDPALSPTKVKSLERDLLANGFTKKDIIDLGLYSKMKYSAFQYRIFDLIKKKNK